MAAEPPSVLLIEAEEDTRKMLEPLLEEWGYRATLVATATEGLKNLLERRFDLIILDDWLPDLDGVELCRQIRDIDQQTPVIFFSAATMGSEDRRAFAVGANAYIYKNGGPGSLREAMAKELNKNHRQPDKHDIEDGPLTS
ncbi:MAG: response regulator [Blastocatellia bacterium]|nr:response regulator [Blastocatellia bacterium]